ncbi:hypothetical protein ASPFODRAFT_47030, partial [Aspergillus luchuensis CBS 106.47]
MSTEDRRGHLHGRWEGHDNRKWKLMEDAYNAQSSKRKDHLSHSVNRNMASIDNGLPFQQQLGRIDFHLPASLQVFHTVSNTS